MTTQKVQRRDVNAAIRVAQAIALRAERIPYEEIAHRCGYGDRGAAYNAVQRELERRIVENVDHLRREEAEMYDELQRRIWPMTTPNPKARDPKKRHPNLFAVDRLLVISDQRRHLLGLDVQSTDMQAKSVKREYDIVRRTTTN